MTSETPLSHLWMCVGWIPHMPLNLHSLAVSVVCSEQYLVGGIPTPLKNMKVSWDDYSQYMENNVPNHQPVDDLWRGWCVAQMGTMGNITIHLHFFFGESHSRPARVKGQQVLIFNGETNLYWNQPVMIHDYSQRISWDVKYSNPQRYAGLYLHLQMTMWALECFRIMRQKSIKTIRMEEFSPETWRIKGMFPLGCRNISQVPPRKRLFHPSFHQQHWSLMRSQGLSVALATSCSSWQRSMRRQSTIYGVDHGVI